MQLQVLVEDFLRHIELERGLSPRTVVQYGDELEKWLAYLCKNGIPADTDDVSVDHLRRWVQDMSSAGLAPRTVKKRLSCLRSFYAFACHYHGLPASPAAAVMSPRIPHTLPDLLTRSEVARLLEACEANHFRLYRIRDKCMLLICCTLGLRRQELLDLRLDDWDAEQRTVRIRKGKGDRERLLPCPDELNAVVSQWLEVRPQTDLPYLFVSRQGHRIGPDSLQHMLARASKAAGLDRPHLHMFRHFAATAIVNGHGTEQARRILGHAGYDTLAVYTHLSVEDLRPAVNHTAAMAGISVRAAGDAADPRLDPGTELAGKQLQDLVASMPDDWRQSPRLLGWLVTEWARQSVPSSGMALAFDETWRVLSERQTVPGLSLDEHLALAEFGNAGFRRLGSTRKHAAEDLLAIGEELGRGLSGVRASGEGVKEAELVMLNSLLPKAGRRPTPVQVLSGVVTVAAQLQSFRTDVPSGRLATEMLVGLLVWEWGLPPLIVPAAERSFWRMLLDRHTAGDHAPVLGYCIARLAGLCGELGHVLSTDGQDAE